jgi:hypothetical protein
MYCGHGSVRAGLLSAYRRTCRNTTGPPLPGPALRILPDFGIGSHPNNKTRETFIRQSPTCPCPWYWTQSVSPTRRQGNPRGESHIELSQLCSLSISNTTKQAITVFCMSNSLRCSWESIQETCIRRCKLNTTTVPSPVTVESVLASGRGGRCWHRVWLVQVRARCLHVSDTCSVYMCLHVS